MSSPRDNRGLKQSGRRAKWTPTESVLTKPKRSSCGCDVVYMAFRTSNVWICVPQVNVNIQSNYFRFFAHSTLFCTNVWKKETFLLFVEGWVSGTKDFERFSVNSSMTSAHKEPVSRSEMFMFSLNASKLLQYELTSGLLVLSDKLNLSWKPLGMTLCLRQSLRKVKWCWYLVILFQVLDKRLTIRIALNIFGSITSDGGVQGLLNWPGISSRIGLTWIF